MYDESVQDVEHEQLIFGFKQRAILSKRKEEDRGMKTLVGWREMKRCRILEDKVLTEEEKSLAGKEKLVKAEVLTLRSELVARLETAMRAEVEPLEQSVGDV